MTNCSSRTQIAAKKGGKNSAAVPLAAMTNTQCSRVYFPSTSPARHPGHLCAPSSERRGPGVFFRGWAEGRAGLQGCSGTHLAFSEPLFEEAS